MSLFFVMVCSMVVYHEPMINPEYWVNYRILGKSSPGEYWIAYKVDGQPYASGPSPAPPEFAISSWQGTCR